MRIYASNEPKKLWSFDAVITTTTANAAAATSTSKRLRNDFDFVLRCVRLNGASLWHASEKMRGTREIVAAATVQGGVNALELATDDLKSDRNFVIKVCAINTATIESL